MSRFTTTSLIGHQGLPVLSHRAALPLSRQALACVTGVIRRHLAAIRSGWRKLPPVQQALLAHPDRPGRRGPALLLGKAPEARP